MFSNDKVFKRIFIIDDLTQAYGHGTGSSVEQPNTGYDGQYAEHEGIWYDVWEVSGDGVSCVIGNFWGV